MGHPKLWWFSEGIHPKMALKNQVKDFYIPLFSNQQIGESTQKVAPKLLTKTCSDSPDGGLRKPNAWKSASNFVGQASGSVQPPRAPPPDFPPGSTRVEGKKAGKVREVCIQKPGWWFQKSFIFIQTWGNDPIWRAYFSNGWFNHQLEKRSTKDMLTSFESHEICRWLGC